MTMKPLDLEPDSVTTTANDDDGTNHDKSEMDTTEPSPPPPELPGPENHLESMENATATEQQPGPSGSVVQEIRENGTPSVLSIRNHPRFIPIEEFRWNLMLLVLNRFPTGLYFHKLEDEYCRVAGMWVKPGMILEGASEWLEVFERTSLRKFFIIKRHVQRFIQVTNYYIMPRVSRSDDEFLEIWESANFKRVMQNRTMMHSIYETAGLTPKHQHIYGTYETDPENLNSTQISRLDHIYGDDDIESDEDINGNENEIETPKENQNVNQSSPQDIQNQNETNPNIEPVSTIAAASTVITTAAVTVNEQQPQQNEVPKNVNEVSNNSKNSELDKEKEVANNAETNTKSNKNVLNPIKENNNSSIPITKQIEDESSKKANTKLNNSSANNKVTTEVCNKNANNENLNANVATKRKAETEKITAEFFRSKKLNMGIDEEEEKEVIDKLKKVLKDRKEKEQKNKLLNSSSSDKLQSNSSLNVNNQPSFQNTSIPTTSTSFSAKPTAQIPDPKSNTVVVIQPNSQLQKQHPEKVVINNSTKPVQVQVSNIEVIVNGTRQQLQRSLATLTPIPTTSTQITIPQQRQQKQYPPSSTPIIIKQIPVSTAQNRSNINSSFITTTTTSVSISQQQPVVTVTTQQMPPSVSTTQNISRPISSTTKTTNIQKHIPQQPSSNTQGTPISNVQIRQAGISSTSSSTLGTNTITTTKDTRQQQKPVSVSVSGSSTQNKASTPISSKLTPTNTTKQPGLNPQQTLNPTTTTTTATTSTTNSKSMPLVSSTSISPEKQTPNSPIVKPAIFNPSPSNSPIKITPTSTTLQQSQAQDSQDVSFSQLSPGEAKNVSMVKINKIMNDSQFIQRITSYIESLLIYKSDIAFSGDLLDFKKNFKSVMNNLYTIPVPLLVENQQLSDFITVVAQFVVNEEKCTDSAEWTSRRDGANCLGTMLNTRYKKQSARDYVSSVYTGALNHQKTKVCLASIYGAVKGFCLLGSDATTRFLFTRIREIGHILKTQTQDSDSDQVNKEVVDIRKDLSSYLAKELFKSSSFDPRGEFDFSSLIARFGYYFTTFICACMMNAPQFQGNLGPNTLFGINPTLFGKFIHFECDIQSSKFVPYTYLKKTDLEEMLADSKSWICAPCNNPLDGPKFLIKEKNKPNNRILEKAAFDLSKWIWITYTPKIAPLNVTIPDDTFVLLDITTETCDSTKKNIAHIIDYLSLSPTANSHNLSINLPFNLRNVILNDYRKNLKKASIEIKKVFPLPEFCENILKKLQWRSEGEKGLPKMPATPDQTHSSLPFSGVLFMKIGDNIKYPNEKRIFWNNVEDISKLGSFMTMYSNSLTFEGILRKLIEIIDERERKAPEIIEIDD